MHITLRILLMALCLAMLCACELRPGTPTSTLETSVAFSESDQQLARAYEERKRHFQIRGMGRVSRLLPDDNQGSQHQRFIVVLKTGQTLLIAHNVDLAPRIMELAVGDEVEFNGEYEWNSMGGIIHWTHHDPKGLHQAGWLKHQGRIYQ